MAKYLFIALLSVLPSLLWAQWRNSKSPKMDTTGVFQISGMIIGEASQQPVAYVQVQLNHSKHGTITSEEGFYSIPATINDTLYYTHLSYKPMRLIVRDYMAEYKGDKSSYIYIVNYMLEDTLSTRSVYILPFKTHDELATAVVNMEMNPNSPDRIARENLDPKVMDAIMKSLPKDGDERYVVGRQMYYDGFARQNMLPMAGLNAMAAVRLLQHVVAEAKKKRNKDLNYWQD